MAMKHSSDRLSRYGASLPYQGTPSPAESRAERLAGFGPLVFNAVVLNIWHDCGRRKAILRVVPPSIFCTDLVVDGISLNIGDRISITVR